MSAQDLEQRARALLAAESRGRREADTMLGPDVASEAAIRAIVAALLQQPAPAIIDNAGKVASAEPVAWITPESIRHLAKMNGPANVVVWNCASGNARVPLYAAPRQPAPVVDDAMVEQALGAKVGYLSVRQLFACEREARQGARAILTAALARAQGVQS